MKGLARAAVVVPLEGDALRAFDEYKRREFIKQDASAARKLILERLAQINGQTTGKSKREATA